LTRLKDYLIVRRNDALAAFRMFVVFGHPALLRLARERNRSITLARTTRQSYAGIDVNL
jgi:hypothetical protein